MRGRRVAPTGTEDQMPKSQIKDEKTYRKLRKHGAGKEKAALIANAAPAKR
jgi:hypothetical protein